MPQLPRRPAMDSVVLENAAGDPVRLSSVMTLVRPALPRGSKPPASWRDTADQWCVAITALTRNAPRENFDYWTGTGLRKQDPAHPGLKPRTIAYEEHTLIVPPTLVSFLESIAGDVLTALDMPADTRAAMDYLESEFGHDGKASDLYRMVESLRQAHDKISNLLRGTGITLAEFAEQVREKAEG